MEKNFESLKADLFKSLANSASRYLKTGLQLFHESRGHSHLAIETAIGNMAIAVELMLKALIALKNPALVFKNLPLEMRAFCASPKDFPKDANLKPFEMEFRAFGYDTIELNDSIALFYIFLPNHKQAFQPYFRFLADVRNRSLHAALPTFHSYELERVGYLAIKLSHLIGQKNEFKYKFTLSEKDKKFLDSFNTDRADRVKKKIELAKQKAKEIEGDVSVSYVHDWQMISIRCPLCKSDATLYGDTSYDQRANGPDDIEEDLTFFADSFECDECGLKLDDVEELRMTGIETTQDRSEDLEKWYKESTYEPY